MISSIKQEVITPKPGVQEVSIKIIKFILSFIDFLSFVTIAEYPAGLSLLAIYRFRCLERYARKEDIQTLNDSNNPTNVE